MLASSYQLIWAAWYPSVLFCFLFTGELLCFHGLPCQSGHWVFQFLDRDKNKPVCASFSCMGVVCAGEESRLTLKMTLATKSKNGCVWRPFQTEGLFFRHTCEHISVASPPLTYQTVSPHPRFVRYSQSFRTYNTHSPNTFPSFLPADGTD